jgi:GntR family transcriptional regulator
MQLTRADPGHRSSQMRGPLPVHLQISEMLIREIAAGRLADGARLPTEREMAANLGIAVGTLRRALADLTEKGLLDRIQGSGNYVRARSDLLGVYAFFRLERIGGGGLPTADTLSVERLRKPSDLPEFGSANEAHRIRRLSEDDVRHGRPADVARAHEADTEDRWRGAVAVEGHGSIVPRGPLLHSRFSDDDPRRPRRVPDPAGPGSPP